MPLISSYYHRIYVTEQTDFKYIYFTVSQRKTELTSSGGGGLKLLSLLVLKVRNSGIARKKIFSLVSEKKPAIVES